LGACILQLPIWFHNPINVGSKRHIVRATGAASDQLNGHSNTQPIDQLYAQLSSHDHIHQHLLTTYSGVTHPVRTAAINKPTLNCVSMTINDKRFGSAGG